jgi:enoyl-[acyl-carrier protein] reductase I
MPEGEVTSEIERYIVAPGQACAYKVGMLKMQELRARAQEQLGDKFDQREFSAAPAVETDLSFRILAKSEPSQASGCAEPVRLDWRIMPWCRPPEQGIAMSLVAECPRCKQLYTVADELLGELIKCQICVSRFEVRVFVPNPDAPPVAPPVVELDVTSPADLDALAEAVGQHVDGLDGVLHAIGFAPPGAFDFLTAGWEDVATAVQVSAYSLKALGVAALPLLGAGGSIVGLTFDADYAWPVYDWMGVAKAAFESTARYLARDLGPQGVRVNLVAAGPIRTTAARSIPGFEVFENTWGERAPLGWDVNNPEPTARACVALLSDWFPATTAEIVHVDGGVHAMGS